MLVCGRFNVSADGSSSLSWEFGRNGGQYESRYCSGGDLRGCPCISPPSRDDVQRDACACAQEWANLRTPQVSVATSVSIGGRELVLFCNRRPERRANRLCQRATVRPL